MKLRNTHKVCSCFSDFQFNGSFFLDESKRFIQIVYVSEENMRKVVKQQLVRVVK